MKNSRLVSRGFEPVPDSMAVVQDYPYPGFFFILGDYCGLYRRAAGNRLDRRRRV
jgi:hypothetical protein